ncbi:MAG TPA: hypothetical protein H9987_08555 [Candidatus Luteococcus avicola]|nr:hypothetical protein [Candidatus Luteococcus avicola]
MRLYLSSYQLSGQPQHLTFLVGGKRRGRVGTRLAGGVIGRLRARGVKRRWVLAGAALVVEGDTSEVIG